MLQTIPLGRSALALYQDQSAPYRTNKAHALQVELEGNSDFIANEPQQWLNNIAEDVLIPKCMWVASKGGSIDLQRLPQPWTIAGSAYTNAPQRFYPYKIWADWNGACEHANVPMGDDHWDCGALDIWYIHKHAAMLVGGLLVDNGHVEDDSEMSKLRCLQAPDDSLFIVSDKGKIRMLELMQTHKTNSDTILNELWNANMLVDHFWTKIGWYGLAAIPWREDANHR